MSKTRYIIYRIVSMVPTLIGVIILIFILSNSIKGDPARMMAGDVADQAMLEQIRQEFQLDQPMHVRLLVYFQNLAQGNLGTSFSTKQPVLTSLMERLPATLELTLFALVFSIVGAIPLGIISAVKRDKPIDHVVRVLSVGGVSMPVFWSGLLLIWLLYVQAGWLPGSGRLSIYSVAPPSITGLYTVDSLLAGNLELFKESLQHLFMPAFILGYSYMAVLARLVRSSMLEVLTQDYIRTARAKGLAERRILMRHGLRNAMLPVITLAGFAFAHLLGGAVITETIFAWPGMGKYLVDAALHLDYPVIMGFTLIIAVIYMVVNLIVDLMYSWLNPQIE